jgi:nitrogen PTS system EIIA component
MDLKIKDVADLLNVSPTTIQRWIDTEKIPCYRINGDIYFSHAELDDWFISHNNDSHDISHVVRHQKSSSASLPISPTTKAGGNKQFSLFRAIHKGDIVHDLTGTTKEEVIRATMAKVAQDLNVDAEVMADLLLDRESLMSTALNNGIAIPHTRDSFLKAAHDIIFIVFLDKPIEYGALDGQPVHTLFFLFACDDKRHLHLLAKIAHLGSQPNALKFFESRPSKAQMLAFVKEWEAQMP